MNQTYYILKPAVDTKETGRAYPAVESYSGYDFKASNSVHNLDSDKFPDFKPDIRFKLAKGAKLCDLMTQSSISSCGLLISEKMKTELAKGVHQMIPHEYYNATIEDNKGTSHQFYWMHLVWTGGIKHLDFKASKFQINEFGTNTGEVEISDYEMLLNKQSEFGFMKMIFNYQTVMHQIEFDLFIHPLNKTIFVSDNLRSTLIENGFTGVQLELASNLLVR
jgi:hypothetical protein